MTQNRHVAIVGAGVAGLQAIASAKRLGAVVEAYDVRAAAKEQVESLGAKFVELPLETAAAEGQGGYAKQLDEAAIARQRELMKKTVAASDVGEIEVAVVHGGKRSSVRAHRQSRVPTISWVSPPESWWC